ncbi:MAG: hypothetical protein IPK50_21260 [Fibrobacterota bacterium]|nr:hypothetical protein [Fibrobacterota bacterium]QQS04779.1 MAG: hypothetical protein IPK50_21260 [Fibrobacterota bacterium]
MRLSLFAKNALTLVVLVSMSGCTQLVLGLGLDRPPPPAMRWIPAQERGTTWRNGSQFVAFDSLGLRVEAAFEEQRSDRLLVRVRLVNDSSPTFDVNPAKFLCISGIRDQAGVEEWTDTASDPAEELRKVREWEQRLRQSGAKTVEDQTDLEMSLSNAVEGNKFWTEEALRRNTLAQGRTAEGIVVFPLQRKARDIQLAIPVSGRVVGLRFEQVPVKTK